MPEEKTKICKVYDTPNIYCNTDQSYKTAGERDTLGNFVLRAIRFKHSYIITFFFIFEKDTSTLLKV